MSTRWPTNRGSLFFSADYPKSSLTRAIREGRVHKLAPGVYTADLTAAPEHLVASHRWRIIARSMPDAVLVDRSAAYAGVPSRGVLFVASDQRKGPLRLPGLTVLPRPGHRALPDDSPWPEGLALASDARTLVDNLAVSRSGGNAPARTLGRAELEQWLLNKYRTRPHPETWLENLRVRALAIANDFDVPERADAIKDLVGLVGRTRPATGNISPPLRAHLRGSGWDDERVAAFDALAEALAARDEALTLSSPEEGDGFTLPFFEAYFSNFIEGTEFTIEEAEAIIRSGQPSPNRPEDAHDILGTWRVVSDPVGRRVTTDDAEIYIELLRDRHRAILGGRPDAMPGTFKTQPNQVGTYRFVEPDLVEGTLQRGLSRISEVPDGFSRAIYVMFVLAEVHPFTDGNGRAARTCMNAELSAVGQSRIIIPTVWRNEYIAGLRKASRDQEFDLLTAILTHAWRWTAAMPWSDRAATEGQLVATNALMDSTDAAGSGKRLELP